MATSKDTSNTDSKEAEKSAEKSTVPTSSESSTNLIDGRIFEAESMLTLNAEEEAELQEFELTLRKYNDLSRKMRKEALKKEQEELNKEEKSPTKRYYEGTRLERIRILETTTKLMDEMEKKVNQRA